MTSLLSSALALAVEQPVIPIEPRGKRPLAGLGLRSATRDLETVAAWFRRWPDANLGARCDNLAVFDVDGPTGETSLDDLERNLGPLPATRAVSTGRGQHLYFRCPALTGNSTQGLGRPAGIDVRGGRRGYVVCPPSVHASGRRYGWANDNPIAELPEAWLERLTRARVVEPRAVETVHVLDLDQETAYGRRALERELERLYGARDGERNEVLNLVVFKLAQLVAGNQLPLARVEREAFEVAAMTGLEAAEIVKTIRSATSAGLRVPRAPLARGRARATVNRGYRGNELDEGHDLHKPQRPLSFKKVMKSKLAGSYLGNPDNRLARASERSALELLDELRPRLERDVVTVRSESALDLLDQVDRESKSPGRAVRPGNLALHRCRRWVHSSDGYRCSECGPLRIQVRTCTACGAETSSATGYFCAACHFAGWWGRWSEEPPA